MFKTYVTFIKNTDPRVMSENICYHLSLYWPSPISISLKAISEPESLINISPLSVNMMFISVRSIIQPTTSPDCHWRPNDSFPTCQRWAWQRKKGFSIVASPRIWHRSQAFQLSPAQTLKPLKTYANSSAPSSVSARTLGLAQPTLISPTVTASNSKYHFPWVTA